MPIFDSYSGRTSLLTAEESDRLNNPGKYDYDQEKYDLLVSILLPKIASRRAADQRSREAVSSSYANFGPNVPGGAGMGTQPLFSLSGMSGHTSGGLSDRSDSIQYAEGGAVSPGGIETLPESDEGPSAMDPILEHHYSNVAEGKSVNNEDGSVSTVYTVQVDIDGVPTLIPTVWDGQILSEDDALLRSIESGKKWPTAETHEDLRQYDIELHKEIENPAGRFIPEVLEGDPQLSNSLSSDFRQSRSPRWGAGNMGFDGRNITGSGSVSFPVNGNPLTLGASGYAGADGAGITDLGASYQMPKKNISLQGSYRPEDKSWQANFVKRFNRGGTVEPVQYMQSGGMASPYGKSMRMASPQSQMSQQFQISDHGMGASLPAPEPQIANLPLGPSGQMGGQQQGVGGLFQRLPQNQMGMMQAQMGGAPLEVYGNYLNNTYTAPAAESSQTKVTEFIDLVDQAERAHFGAEESFGYGGGAYQMGLLDQYKQPIPPPIGQGTQMSAGNLERFRVY